jgi:hypothetical protein
MKTTWLAAAAIPLVLTTNVASALADGPRASSNHSVSQTTDKRALGGHAVIPHYEWQYHYVGHHARLEGHWVLVN